ncbi:hypothetical protein CFC21_039593 [Triticum aestivum]|uniref:Uncharacterized protein n=3 Tax=Triticum TaxID=4564 RepID=A0A9R1FFR3_WHEAT|nr:uncharacterized protein At2g39795, mitochondrial-like [Triticum dicoccoides]XP_044344055.1 uncharacterized protein At2g39795, mitochondrial-like isoform X2 [Triticum aestivum]KAF7027555.1 hypothetical protein CFC21_039588 [Triticum aestivum]KAF7027560.1 hypothetical protein CFC21_039593 [Triticum aestivum]
MALLAAARRASAVIRPRVAAATFSSTKRSSSSFSVCALRAKVDSCRDEATVHRTNATPLRAHAESVNATIHDWEVIDVIDSVMRSRDSGLVDGIPSDFPFEILKEEGLKDITLTRSLKGEQIEVVVSMLKPDGDEEESSDSRYTSDEDEGDSSMPLMVTVSKADGSNLKFTCTAYPDNGNIFIDTLSVRLPPSGAMGHEEDDRGFSELDETLQEARSELDDNLQETFRKYLELRGVTPMNMKLLHQYLISKDILCNQLWLTKLRDFVKKD